MTVPFLKSDQLIALLNQHGFVVALDSEEFWNLHVRIILLKDGQSYVVQYRPIYHFSQVVLTCELLGIDPPKIIKDV